MLWSLLPVHSSHSKLNAIRVVYGIVEWLMLQPWVKHHVWLFLLEWCIQLIFIMFWTIKGLKIWSRLAEILLIWSFFPLNLVKFSKEGTNGGSPITQSLTLTGIYHTMTSHTLMNQFRIKEDWYGTTKANLRIIF